MNNLNHLMVRLFAAAELILLFPARIFSVNCCFDRCTNRNAQEQLKLTLAEGLRCTPPYLLFVRYLQLPQKCSIKPFFFFVAEIWNKHVFPTRTGLPV